MSTHQSPLPAAPFSSSEVLNVLHRGREHAAREKNSFPRRMERMKNDTKVMGPDAIWGQYNNYRSNGLMGSVVVHAVLLGLILFVTFSPKAVELVKPHETVTLIAPSPDEYALPVAKKIIAGAETCDGADYAPSDCCASAAKAGSAAHGCGSSHDQDGG